MAFSSSSHFLLSPHLPNPRKPLSIHSSSNSSSNSSSSFDLQSYWSSLLAQINTHLDSSIPIRYPESIFKSMRHSVLSPGAKRAAPVLCISVASGLFDLPIPSALPTAAALEMVHAASLIHDDLPYFDASPSRRGLPSNHSLFGVDLAVLAGDSLLPLAIQHLTTLTPLDPSVLIAVIKEITRAVGSTGMAAGQFLDLHFQDCNGDGIKVKEIVEKKFGEMGECAAVCGGYLGGATEEELGRLRRYGRAVATLYQLMDDVLTTTTEREDGGMRRNVSVVKAVGLERATEMVEEIRGEAKKEVEELERKFGERKVMPLYSFLDYAVERGFVVEVAPPPPPPPHESFAAVARALP